VIDPENPSRTAGTVCLVLGLLAVFPFGALAGVPAVVLAIYALREEPRSRGRARAGGLLGGLGIALTAALVMLFPLMVKARRPAAPSLARTDATRYNLYEFQYSLEEWAAEHGGALPYEWEFDSDSSRFVEFLARDKAG